MIFDLLGDHLVDMGMQIVGSRLYFMNVLSQLHAATVVRTRATGQLPTSSRTPTLLSLQRAGLPIEVTSWSAKQVRYVTVTPDGPRGPHVKLLTCRCFSHSALPKP